MSRVSTLSIVPLKLTSKSKKSNFFLKYNFCSSPKIFIFFPSSTSFLSLFIMFSIFLIIDVFASRLFPTSCWGKSFLILLFTVGSISFKIKFESLIDNVFPTYGLYRFSSTWWTIIPYVLWEKLSSYSLSSLIPKRYFL